MQDIGVIIPKLTQYGGAERLLIECLARWQHKHPITLYATSISGALLREHGICEKRVRWARLTPPFEGPQATLLNGLLLPKIWEQELGAHDVYHAHQWPTHLIDRHPLVWYPHEPWRCLHDLRYDKAVDGIARSLTERVEHYALGRHGRLVDHATEATLSIIEQFDRLGFPDRIVANSRASARYLEKVYGRPVPDVVYPGVTASDFIPLGTPENLVVAVGGLAGHKRLRLVLEAVRQVEGLDLYVAGDGNERDKLTHMAEALGIARRTHFLHGLTNREIQVLLARSLAVVFTPIREPFGIVALEALAAGRPLIAVHGGGYAEVVDDACAFLVPPEPEAIADRIRFLSTHPEIGRRMGEAGRQRATEYSWDRTADELLHIIAETHTDWASRRSPQRCAAKATAPLVGAHYLCDYGEGLGSGGWQLPGHGAAVTDMPALGHYASYQGAVIENHLRTLQQSGFDFVVLHLHLSERGPNGYELTAAEHILAIAERERSALRFAVQLSTGACPPESVDHMLSVVRHVFATRANYLRLRSQPLLFVDWTPRLDQDAMRRQRLLDGSEGFLRIVGSPWPVLTGTVLERLVSSCAGWCLSHPLLASGSKNWEATWLRAYQASGPIRAFTVCPGYDDSHLTAQARPWPMPQTLSRDDGAPLRRMADFALALDPAPDLVLVNSFNDFRLNTHIERSQAHGARYMELIEAVIERVRRRWPEQPARAA